MTPPESAKYELSINGAGGVRVWLDGKLVIDDWVQRAAPAGRGAPPDPAVTAARRAEVSLEKGKNYDLKVEFFRDAAAAAAAGAGGPARGAAPGGAGPGRGGFGGLAGPTLFWNAENDVADAVAAARQADVVIAVVGITGATGRRGDGRQPRTAGRL